MTNLTCVSFTDMQVPQVPFQTLSPPFLDACCDCDSPFLLPEVIRMHQEGFDTRQLMGLLAAGVGSFDQNGL